MKKYLLFSSTFALACLFSSTTKAQNNYSLTCNGSTYVSCGSNAAFNASNIKTMECWVKFDDFTGNQEILSRSVGSTGIELLLYNSNLAFFCMNSPSVGSHVDYPLTNLSTGVWYHVAATWDGTKENMRLYVNGISVGTRADNGNINTVGVSEPSGTFMIGQWSQNGDNRLLKGTVDEVRIWNITRSAGSIKSGMYANYPANTAGLIAYYPLNESSGMTVNNMTTTSGLTGTISGTSTRVSSPIKFASNALNFDGVNDQVIVQPNSLLDISAGTVECWVRPTALSTSVQSCFVGNRNTTTRFSLHMASNQIGLFNELYGYKTLAYSFSNNTWYHLAFVFGAGGTNVYINGTYINTVAFAPSSVTGQLFTIGITKSNTGADMEAFTGDIDDVRVWNNMRTPSQIYSNMNTPLTGTESGLVANYTFNAGINSTDNAGLKIAIDATPNNLHGTLTNMNLTGTTSNYVASSVVILPVQLSDFAANKSGATSLLNWTTAQEQNSKNFIVERSSDGNHFTAIGTVAAARNSSTANTYAFTDVKPAAGTNYYRLQLNDADGKSSYTKTIAVKFPPTEVTSVSPNPASSTLHYSVSSLQATKATVSIISTAGQKVWTSIMAVQAGSNNLSVDVSRLPAGNYTLQVLNTPAGVASSQQFSVAR